MCPGDFFYFCLSVCGLTLIFLPFVGNAALKVDMLSVSLGSTAYFRFSECQNINFIIFSFFSLYRFPCNLSYSRLALSFSEVLVIPSDK